MIQNNELANCASCCMGCASRHVGCRSACAEWEKHEAEKTERYNRNKTDFAGRYNRFDSRLVNLVQRKWECVNGR